MTITEVSPKEAATVIAQHEDLWRAMGGTEDQNVEFPEGDEFKYLECRQGNLLIGYVILHRVGERVWKAHAAFLPKHWGKKGRRLTKKAGTEAFNWAFANTDASFLLGEVPHDFPQVQHYAIRLGMRPTLRDDHQITFQVGRDEWASLTTY